MSKDKEKKEDILKLIKRKLRWYKEKNIEKIPIRFLKKDLESYDLDEDDFGDILFDLKEDDDYIKKIVRPNQEDCMADGYGLGSISGMDDNNFPGIFWINVSKDFNKLYKNYLVKKDNGEPENHSKDKKIIFKDGILLINGKKLDFNRKRNQKELLDVLFKDPRKYWSYDEIQDIWDEFSTILGFKKKKNYWRKFYTASDEINKTIAIELGIKEFIIKDTKQVKINPKYI